MVFTGNAEPDELKQLVIASDTGAIALWRFARPLPAGPCTHVGQECTEGGGYVCMTDPVGGCTPSPGCWKSRADIAAADRAAAEEIQWLRGRKPCAKDNNAEECVGCPKSENCHHLGQECETSRVGTGAKGLQQFCQAATFEGCYPKPSEGKPGCWLPFTEIDRCCLNATKKICDPMPRSSFSRPDCYKKLDSCRITGLWDGKRVCEM